MMISISMFYRISILFLFIAAISTNIAAAQVQHSVPAKIVLLKPKPLELPVGGKLLVEVEVFDSQGNRVRGTEVKWRLAKADDDAFAYLGSVKNDSKTNSVELVWRPGPSGSKAPSEVLLIAQAGDALAVEPIKYNSASPEEVMITCEPAVVEVQPRATVTAKVIVRSKKDDRILKDTKITTEDFADPDLAQLVRVVGPTTDNTITFIGQSGDPTKPKPLINSALVIHAAGATQALPVRYLGEPVKTMWELISSEIVGDNYGRSIKQNYYGIEVTIQNYSGSDIALAGLVFERQVNNQTVLSPVSSYNTVRGTLAKRKLTHPRTLTLGIVDGVGSLMTGFNPFFHNDAHKANFSTFIDIISNPLAKGLSSVWKDTYADEVTRFEQNVLKDDKNITTNTSFKTMVFFPKRLLFTDKDPKRNNPEDVRKALGRLIVMGYKFQKGALTDLSQTP